VCGGDQRLVCSTTLVGGAEGTCVGNMTLNGAYGIYPTDCTNTTVEYCQAQGASDAGIYIGKCTGGTVENNVVYENVAGLEVENCVDVDASNNAAFDNVGGLFALQQDISGSMQSNTNVRFLANESYCNNRPNFAKPGSAVAGIPVGTGVLSFAGNGVEFADNVITDNLTLGIGMASNVLNCQISGGDCPEYNEGYDPYVQNNYIHDNVFTNNGTDPQGDFGLVLKLIGVGVPGTPVPDVVWDGYQPRVCDGGDNAGAACFANADCPDGSCISGASTTNDAANCLGTDPDAAASLLLLGDSCGYVDIPDELTFIGCAIGNQPTDPNPFYCEPTQ
jgi:parallel beta-helix repeat protein